MSSSFGGWLYAEQLRESSARQRVIGLSRKPEFVRHPLGLVVSSRASKSVKEKSYAKHSLSKCRFGSPHAAPASSITLKCGDYVGVYRVAGEVDVRERKAPGIAPAAQVVS
jgi:hypothetical protein